MRPSVLAHRRNSRGMTLIEVLIAIVIFAVGLLGIAALQVAGLRYTKGSQARSVAALQAENMIDRMRANSIGVDSDFYLAVDPESIDCDSADCSPTQLAAFDYARWLSETRQALGVKRNDGLTNVDAKVNATICIDSTPNDGTSTSWACDNTGNVYAIKIEWQERSLARAGKVTDTYSNSSGSGADTGFVLNRFVMRFIP
jgi:type IV pilus assembly protein PilV